MDLNSSEISDPLAPILVMKSQETSLWIITREYSHQQPLVSQVAPFSLIWKYQKG